MEWWSCYSPVKLTVYQNKGNEGQFGLVNSLTRVPIDSHHFPIIFPYRRCCHHCPTFSRAFLGWFPHPPNLTAFCARVPRLSKGIKKAKRARWALGPGRGWWTPQTQWNFFEFWWLTHFSEKNMRYIYIWYMSLSVGMMIRHPICGIKKHVPNHQPAMDRGPLRPIDANSGSVASFGRQFRQGVSPQAQPVSLIQHLAQICGEWYASVAFWAESW